MPIKKYWFSLIARIQGLPCQSRLTIDASGVNYCDVSGLTLLVKAESLCCQHGIGCEVIGLAESFEAIRRKFSDEKYLFEYPRKAVSSSIPEDVGRSTVSMLEELRNYVEYTGQECVVMIKALSRPRSIRWADVVTTFEKGLSGFCFFVSISP